MDLLNSYFRPAATFMPFVLGILVMLGTNTVWLEWGINPRTGVIAISALFALIVFTDRSLPFFLSLIYYAMMSVFLYVVAIGTNETLHQYVLTEHKHNMTSKAFSFNPDRKENIREFFQDW